MGIILPYLVHSFGWRIAILSAGLSACIVAFAIQPFRRRLDGGRNQIRTVQFSSIVRPLNLVWRESRLRCLALSGFIFSGSQVSLASFFVVYLTDALSMTLTTAGLIFTTMQMGGVMGRLLWGAIADTLVPANLVLTGLGFATTFFSVIAYSIGSEEPLALLVTVSFLLGATSHGWNGVYNSELVKFAPTGTIGDVASGCQFSLLAGIVLIPAIFGLVVTFYSYFAAFTTIACAMLIATTYMRLIFSKSN